MPKEARLESVLTRLHTGTTRRQTAPSEILQFPENIFSPALIKTDIQIWEKSKHRKISLVGRRGEHSVGVFPASKERKRPIKILPGSRKEVTDPEEGLVTPGETFSRVQTPSRSKSHLLSCVHITAYRKPAWYYQPMSK